jgi:hypothetical protein
VVSSRKCDAGELAADLSQTCCPSITVAFILRF